MTTSASQATIEILRNICATHGLPEVIGSDNGTCFTSQELFTFLTENGIRHICRSPFHPASNGSAEQAVQIVRE